LRHSLRENATWRASTRLSLSIEILISARRSVPEAMKHDPSDRPERRRLLMGWRNVVELLPAWC
jgi:hypothetical protein